MRIGVYVGSFNPVHNGHIQIARQCIEQGLVDQVLIIATGSYWEKKDLLPLNVRLDLLSFFEDEKIIIDHKHNDLPYTCQIFDALHEEDQENDYDLIVGADNLPRFHEWREYRKLLENGLIIIARGEVNKKEIDRIMEELGSTAYQILNIENIDISSTYIREHLDDYDAISGMIDKRVYDYLKKGKDLCSMK